MPKIVIKSPMNVSPTVVRHEEKCWPLSPSRTAPGKASSSGIASANTSSPVTPNSSRQSEHFGSSGVLHLGLI